MKLRLKEYFKDGIRKKLMRNLIVYEIKNYLEFQAEPSILVTCSLYKIFSILIL